MITNYQLGNSLYLNITNACTNRCDFCIRNTTQGPGEKSLWLEREPLAREIIADLPADLKQFDEVVFCGYGEPLVRLEVVKEVAAYLRQQQVKSIRINTNGQANLIHRRNIVPDLVGLVDVVSISLNAENAEKYQAKCHSVYGKEAYSALLEFAAECRKHLPRVILTVVDDGTVDIGACHKIAETLGVELRIRHYYPEFA
ncbi:MULTISPECIES: TatD family nuclease-associated radical SAM protein [Carboxydocella]|uniref:Radical SAM protein, TatD family-associated n=2 Tax=Carboxydocella TaxID=178898 RepID=A0A1T4RIJ7_9FIRM|nr:MULTISPECIES: TatD family nuclease-associated radical SAM protein [Carboxydocella]AVX20796.1 radical SAM protein, TatD family-associated [Carboxydocella thermautotrophica]AVX31215.1 radical SAM protein, TatD family-associated [Carboxydocella thermautotrophica]SKA15810.1 radical SAM protein, TatD family-associated [Carboxydocella sporoproducens DSM 16521]GAW30031.1 radical SAM domain protein [Carboxydocella sp. ULO1]GAW32104.1 radical SAM domain protein [Carboxydocella sp. JDF658]